MQVRSRRNRYNDIKAFDHSRVKLKRRPGDANSDYINANFVKVESVKLLCAFTQRTLQGYGTKRFIAAQGPLPDTVADFWQMIYEQNVVMIVMATQLIENYRVYACFRPRLVGYKYLQSQCHRYWPAEDNGVQLAGALRIKMTSAMYYNDHTIRWTIFLSALTKRNTTFQNVPTAQRVGERQCDERAHLRYNRLQQQIESAQAGHCQWLAHHG